MLKVGAPLSLIGALLSATMIHVFGGLESVFDIWNQCPEYMEFTPFCQDYLNITSTEL